MILRSLLVLVLACPCCAQVATFTSLGDPSPGDPFDVRISGDGNIIQLDNGYRWTEQSGFVQFLSQDTDNLSYDGSVVVGRMDGPPPGPMRWTSTGGSVWLGNSGRAVACSADGDYIAVREVGVQRWHNGVLASLIVFTAFTDSADISADGTALAFSGYGKGGSPPQRSYIWREGVGLTNLGTLPGSAPSSHAWAISASGRVVVGDANPPPCCQPYRRAYRWTERHGMHALGPAVDSTEAHVVRDDGWVILGDRYNEGVSQSFIWDPVNGMRDLSTQLGAWGATGHENWRYLAVTDISYDGRVVVGWGIRNVGQPEEVWIARIPAFCYANCDGSTTAPAMNVADFTCFLRKFAAQDIYANCDNDAFLNVADFNCFLQKFAEGCP